MAVLADNKYEIPAFRRLDDTAKHIRQVVHEQIYEQTIQSLSSEDKKTLDDLLIVQNEDYKSDFTTIKASPSRNTLKQMRLWTQRLDWLNNIIQPTDFTSHIKYTKIRQFAAQAKQLEVGDMKDISTPAKQYTFLLCFLQEAQMRTRDELMNMFLKRIRQTHNQAKDQLEQLKAQYRLWEEQMMQTLNQVVDSAAKETKDSVLGKRVRTNASQDSGNIQ